MKRIYESDDQFIDCERVTHVLTWLIPMPTRLPLKDLETFSFWKSGVPCDGGERIVIRFLSQEKTRQDLDEATNLMKLGSILFTDSPIGNSEESMPGIEEIASVEESIAEISAFLNLHDLESDDELAAIRGALDEALGHLRQIQHAVFALDQIPRPLTTTQSLPMMVPYSIHSVNGMEPSLDLGIYLIPSVMQAQAHWYIPGDPSESNNVHYLEGNDVSVSLDRQLAKGPFSGYSQLINEAQVSALNAGLPRAAVLTAASAGEVLLDETLRCVLWEAGFTPEKAGELFANKRDFKPRITNQLPAYLGGNWKVKGNDGVVASWFSGVYKLRHDIVHAGRYPSDRETEQAISVTFDLNRFVADRVAAKIHTYPRTAMFLLGIPGIKSRGLWDSGIEKLAESRTEPDWINTFARWREYMEKARKLRATGQALSGDIDHAEVFFWVSSSGVSKWVALDNQAFASAEIDPKEIEGVSEEDLDQVAQRVALAKNWEPEESLFRSFPDAKIKTRRELDWRLPYHNMPMLNAMCDGTDVDSLTFSSK